MFVGASLYFLCASRKSNMCVSLSYMSIYLICVCKFHICVQDTVHLFFSLALSHFFSFSYHTRLFVSVTVLCERLANNVCISLTSHMCRYCSTFLTCLNIIHLSLFHLYVRCIVYVYHFRFFAYVRSVPLSSCIYVSLMYPYFKYAYISLFLSL